MSKHDERLNPNSPIPLYHQLATILLAKLERGEIPLGSCIEPEWKLVERYGVSRTTVRRAIQELVQMGVLENKRGKGTIVKTNRVIRDIPGFTSFAEEIRALGRTPRTKLVSFTYVTEPEKGKVRKKLRLAPGEEIIRIERLRYSDDTFLGISTSYIPAEIWDRGNLRPELLNDASLYALLEEYAGVSLAEGDETIEVVYADDYLVEMGLPKEIPILKVSRITYSTDGTIVEYGYNQFRADRYKIRIRHRRFRVFAK